VKKCLKKYACFLIVLLAPVAVQGVTLHSIIVADTLCDIGFSVQADLKNVDEEVEKIAKFTGMDISKISVSEEKVTTSEMLELLDDVVFDDDDVVLFYFAGHGYRTCSKDRDNLWPILYFSLDDVGIDHEYITQALIEKNPRLLLSVVDVCNNYLPESYCPPMFSRSMSRAATEKEICDNYKELFLNFHGVIRVAGAKAGQVSWGSSSGGFFTKALFLSLTEEVLKLSHPDWEQVCDRTAYLMEYDEQEPYYLVETKCE